MSVFMDKCKEYGNMSDEDFMTMIHNKGKESLGNLLYATEMLIKVDDFDYN